MMRYLLNLTIVTRLRIAYGLFLLPATFLFFTIYANTAQQVAGWSSLSGGSPSHAFQWTQTGGIQDFGTLGGQNSSALAINRSGQMAGFSDLSQAGVTHAAVWTGPNQIQDLGTLGGSYATATGINDAGAVAGWSSLE